ncbi:DUF3037 domain-containing protein [Acidicapsa acidisoli]|uniref:DUF3037 domain-containing protein n=1 Tax=Acidicapsa acidisoli TaxID=1615681 RepID=UPI0021E07D20|nr:DUF3037 domain-containing protein [Acidicapsa acidisoli]
MKSVLEGVIGEMEREQGVFFLIRYFPDPIRDEPLNIGVILLSVDKSGNQLPVVRLTKNWDRVLRIDPDADIELLSQLEEFWQMKLSETGSSAGAALEQLNESLSNTLRLERKSSSTTVSLRDGKGLLTDNFEGEIDRLMMLYVEERH